MIHEDRTGPPVAWYDYNQGVYSLREDVRVVRLRLGRDRTLQLYKTAHQKCGEALVRKQYVVVGGRAYMLHELLRIEGQVYADDMYVIARFAVLGHLKSQPECIQDAVAELAMLHPDIWERALALGVGSREYMTGGYL